MKAFYNGMPYCCTWIKTVTGMKKTLLFLFIFSTSLIINAQDFRLSKGDTLFIYIKINGLKKTTYLSKRLHNSLPYENESEDIRIKNDTLLIEKIVLFHPIQVNLVSDFDKDLNASCFLIPQDTLFVFFNLDSSSNPKIRFEGKTALISKYLTYNKFNYRAIPKKEQTIGGFINEVDSLNKIADDSLHHFLLKNNLPEWFIMTERSNIQYQSYYWKSSQFQIRYCNYHQYFNRPIHYIDDLKINLNDTYAQFNDFYTDVLWECLSNPYNFDILLCEQKNSCINNYNFRKEILLNAKERLKNSTKDNCFISIISNSLNNLDYSTAIANHDSSYFTRIDSLYDLIKNNFSDSIAYYVLKNNRENQLKKAKFGMRIYTNKTNIHYSSTLPNICLATPTGDSIRLSDFKGKIICLNFWATWCGACIASFPEKNELIQKYSNKNLVFINVCIDNKIGLWKKYIESKGLKGYNVICTDDQAIYLKSLFLINSIPQYTLIGEKGNFLIEKTNNLAEIEKILVKNSNKQ
jgi:thiol-disulfide isomerase/thioredoxin